MNERVKLNARKSSGGSKSRFEWVDSAKAISITLVVLWHTVEYEWYFNELLFFLRMPLFFFVAGFFARGAVTGSISQLFRKRVSNFLYLYVLWFLIIFALTTVLISIRNGQGIPIPNLTQIFVEPPATLWFIYALAIIYAIAKPLMLIPPIGRVILVFIVYCISAATGEWGVIPFYDNVMRLLIFFVLGDLTFSSLKALPQRYNKFSVVLLIAFMVLSWAIFRFGLTAIGPLTFAASAIGILGLILACRWLDDWPMMRPLKFMGTRTIYVYLMHRIVMVYALAIYTMFGLPNDLTMRLLTFALAIPLTLFAGVILDRYLPMLFVAPWNLSRRGISPSILKRDPHIES